MLSLNSKNPESTTSTYTIELPTLHAYTQKIQRIWRDLTKADLEKNLSMCITLLYTLNVCSLNFMFQYLSKHKSLVTLTYTSVHNYVITFFVCMRFFL